MTDVLGMCRHLWRLVETDDNLARYRCVRCLRERYREGVGGADLELPAEPDPYPPGTLLAGAIRRGDGTYLTTGPYVTVISDVPDAQAGLRVVRDQYGHVYRVTRAMLEAAYEVKT